jgi:radical SAM superfamily enzyme YgiQ (UPF0313 family)
MMMDVQKATDNLRPNILFIHLPSVPLDQIEQVFVDRHQPDFSFTITMPLGILYLSSHVKEHGNVGQIEIVDYPPNIEHLLKYDSIDDFIRQIAQDSCDFTPDIIAFSTLFSTAHQFLLKSTRILKEIWPDAHSIVGGIHATNCVSELLEIESIDFVGKGEGELAFTQFVNAFGTDEIYTIPGIHSGLSDKGFYGACEMADDLDDLPFPDWNLLDMPTYVRETSKSLARNGGRFEENPGAIIMTTRGCPFSCTFCASHTVHGRKLRFRSVENVIAEVKGLYEEHGVTTIIPEDDLFTGNRKKVIELLDAFEKIDIPNFELHFPNALSVNTLHDDVMDALMRAGMSVTSIAIESGSDFVQREIIKKRVKLDRAREVVEYLRSRSVIVRCFFIVGFPGETKEQMMETVEFAKSLGADWCFFGVAVPLIGSEMYDQFADLGVITKDTEQWANTVYGTRSFDTKEISPEEIEALAYRTNLDVNFLNNSNFKLKQYDRVIEIFKDIVVKYPFHIFAHYCMAKAHALSGDHASASECSAEMVRLIETDRRSRAMYHKYGDLLPDVVELLSDKDLDEVSLNDARHISDRLALRLEQSLSLSAG